MLRGTTGQIKQCTQNSTVAGLRAGCSAGKWAPLQQTRPRRAVKCAVHQPSASESVPEDHSAPGIKAERLPVLSLIAASVESTAALSAFETVAGRGAMIGFVIAAVAEVFTPHQGLFTVWGGQELTTYGAATLLLICAAAVLAATSKRRSAKLSRAILTSLTALAGSGGSKGLDGALDFVFEKVFSTRMVEFTFFDVDDYL